MSHTTVVCGSRPSRPVARNLDELFARLLTHPLDPALEKYGNFVMEWTTPGDVPHVYGTFRFWGNFFDHAFPFQVDTDDPVLIAKLTAAIRTNQETPAYLAAQAAQNMA